MADDITVKVLREIRDAVRANGERLSGVETAVLEMAEQQRFVVRWLRADRERESHLVGRVGSLEERVEAIEDRLPDS